MKGLFEQEAFAGLGQSRFAIEPSYSTHVIQGPDNRRLRRGVRGQCPRVPGVYAMVDRQGEVIYVGKARSLRARLLSYFRPRSRDPKAGRILSEAALLGWEILPDELSALLRELELIQRWKPRHNVQGQPRRIRRSYVCVGRPPAPYVFLSARPPRNALSVHGPIPVGSQAREAVRRLNDWFRLRDCSQSQKMVFAEQRELFALPRSPGCLRLEISSCLGPCAAACTGATYGEHVASAQAFLTGKDLTPLELLEQAMAEASAALAFERAAALRDRLEPLRWLAGHLQRLRKASAHSFVYRVRCHTGRVLWYLIERGRVLAIIPSPERGREAETLALLELVYQNPTLGMTPLSPDEISSVLLVDAWFRRRAEERVHILSPEDALALCRNGVGSPSASLP